MRIVSATDLKRNTADILNEVVYKGKPIFVERYEKVVARIVPETKSYINADNYANLRKKYFGASSDFPEIHKERSRRRWKKID